MKGQIVSSCSNAAQNKAQEYLKKHVNPVSNKIKYTVLASNQYLPDMQRNKKFEQLGENSVNKMDS